MLIVINLNARRATNLQGPVDYLRDNATARVRWPGDPRELADDLVSAVGAHQPIVVVGGDGTVRAVLQQLWDLDLAGAVVGVLPYGRCNRLARSAGIPSDPRAAARVVLNGGSRACGLVVDDLGRVAAHSVVAGPALAAVAADRASHLGRLASWVGLAAWPDRQARQPLELVVDDAVVWERAALVGVLGLNPEPATAGTDRLLEVAVVPQGWRLPRLAAARRLAGTPDLLIPGAVRARGRSATACWTGPVVMDGDILVNDAPRRYAAHAGAWTLTVPSPPGAERGGQNERSS